MRLWLLVLLACSTLFASYDAYPVLLPNITSGSGYMAGVCYANSSTNASANITQFDWALYYVVYNGSSNYTYLNGSGSNISTYPYYQQGENVTLFNWTGNKSYGSQYYFTCLATYTDASTSVTENSNYLVIGAAGSVSNLQLLVGRFFGTYGILLFAVFLVGLSYIVQNTLSAAFFTYSVLLFAAYFIFNDLLLVALAVLALLIGFGLKSANPND